MAADRSGPHLALVSLALAGCLGQTPTPAALPQAPMPGVQVTAPAAIPTGAQPTVADPSPVPVETLADAGGQAQEAPPAPQILRTGAGDGALAVTWEPSPGADQYSLVCDAGPAPKPLWPAYLADLRPCSTDPTTSA